jgi:anti-sigma regulatory factor (Ser/Thr protein kinase)
MKVFIPNSAFLGNINSFLSALDTKNDKKLEISANAKWISVHPLVISMIAALGSRVGIGKGAIFCDDILAPSGHYLKRMGLFKFLHINPKVKNIEEHEPAGRLIPLTQIRDSDELNSFLKDLVPLLHLDRDPKHATAIQHIFSELIRNVLEHANEPSGAMVCAQYFNKTNKISIGVADAGVGLKQSIGRSYSVKDDLNAIQLALTPGITGTTKKPGGTEVNAGFGLFLIKSIAYVNSDFFLILSGNKMYKLLQRKGPKLTLKSDPLQERHSLMDIPFWKGTAVGVDISLDQTQEFDSLLDVIHAFYSKQVSGRKGYYNKPKFI